MLTIRGLETVLCDLASMGFNARWGVISAADVGAPHLRERIWIVANNHSNSKSTQSVNAKQVCKPNMANTNSAQCKRSSISSGIPQKNANISGHGSNAEVSDTSSIRQSGSGEYEQPFYSAESCNGETNNAQSIGGSKLWPIEPAVGRVANGVAARMDRLKAIGNGQVPRVAATAWSLLNG
jgi:DNA (cytosine-5)-methyltransferase 1